MIYTRIKLPDDDADALKHVAVLTIYKILHTYTHTHTHTHTDTHRVYTKEWCGKLVTPTEHQL